MQKFDLPKLGADGLILEGIVTTRNKDGSVNISPMGPIVDASISQFVFRPYRTSTTYKNLKRTGGGVFHITDDVVLFAQAALGQPEPLPQLEGLVLTDTCRWYAFEIDSLDDSQQRTLITAHTVDQSRNRDFFGFNRAKHAVLEAAILATRVDLLPAAEIFAELERLKVPLEKTASSAELRAFGFLRDHIELALAQQSIDAS
ncbi:MAG: DUF447 family protein [Planctomycetes bacterium]|nr:DUF447 family protein [Planctomycetota bacterium]